EIHDTVAIKVLPPDFSSRRDFEDLRHRFYREAEALRKVKHPNVCILYDIRHDDGFDYLVMEYVEGETLQDLLKRPLNISEFMEIAEECLEALSEVHKKKILHRDIKPENILLDASGRVKLCDFGLAKRLPDVGTARQESSKSLSGTPL